jgi:hypothetical protein
MDATDPTLSVRFTRDEVSAIHNRANARGLSKAAWIREVVRRELHRQPRDSEGSNNGEGSRQ